MLHKVAISRAVRVRHDNLFVWLNHEVFSIASIEGASRRENLEFSIFSSFNLGFEEIRIVTWGLRVAI